MANHVTSLLVKSKVHATSIKVEMKYLYLWIVLCLSTSVLASAQTACCDANHMKKDVELLSSSAMQGRGPSTSGLRAAAVWIKGEFERSGLKGGLPNGSFFQDFPYTPTGSSQPISLSNVVGVLNNQGPTQETIILGAHYDHLGSGPAFSMAQGQEKYSLHPGADDNASGTAVLLEIARYFGVQKKKLNKRIVFISFSGEEEGELGSKYYIQHPVVPLANTVAMINLDMVGRIRGEVVGIAGNKSGDILDEVLNRASSNLKLKVMRGGEEYPDDSDHAPFAAANIPILYVCSGSHDDRHTPRDTPDKINPTGMAEVAELVSRIIEQLEDSPRPQFVARPK